MDTINSKIENRRKNSDDSPILSRTSVTYFDSVVAYEDRELIKKRKYDP